jgi:hypothetical protein
VLAGGQLANEHRASQLLAVDAEPFEVSLSQNLEPGLGFIASAPAVLPRQANLLPRE